MELNGPVQVVEFIKLHASGTKVNPLGALPMLCASTYNPTRPGIKINIDLFTLGTICKINVDRCTLGTICEM